MQNFEKQDSSFSEADSEAELLAKIRKLTLENKRLNKELKHTAASDAEAEGLHRKHRYRHGQNGTGAKGGSRRLQNREVN